MNKKIPRSTKAGRVLLALCAGSLHRFEAERLGDHTLPSTISRLEGYGVPIERKPLSVPTRFGRRARVMSYWVPASARADVRAMVA